MARYYRVQPAGLGLDHRSETSAFVTETFVDEETGEEFERETCEPVLADGLHVFLTADEAERLPNGIPEAYGDEVVVIETDDESWDNEDCEGVCIDGAKARIVARIPHAEFRAADWS